MADETLNHHKFDQHTMLCKDCGLHWGKHYGIDCPVKYKIGTILKKYDDLCLYKLLRYYPCENFECELSKEIRMCEGYGLTVTDLSGGGLLHCCPIRIKNGVYELSIFTEIENIENIEKTKVQRIIVFGEGWELETKKRKEIQSNEE